jgi:hypothetical protein
MIIGLGYQAEVGKDAAGKILVEEYGFTRFGFADKLKALALDIDPIVSTQTRLSQAVKVHGWENAKRVFPEVRPFLQRLGSGCRHQLHDSIWVNRVVDELYAHPYRDVVITDVRYRNEARAILKAGSDNHVPTAIVQVTRPGYEGANDHPSETGLHGYGFNYVLLNDGTLDDLGHRVAVMLDALASQSS